MILFQLLFCTFAAEWGYEGQNGPNNWPAACAVGKAQSPIDLPIVNNERKTYEKIVFRHYDETPKTATMVNNGHTVQMTMSLHNRQKMPDISGGGLPSTYKFAQLHFHWGGQDETGSEHTMDGKSYPMELHLVHFNTKYGDELGSAIAKGRGQADTLAVLGIFYRITTEDNKDFQKIIDALNSAKYKDDSSNVSPFALEKVLPRNTDGFYRYPGSLTTPGCNEIVVWTVFKDYVGISSRQMSKFRSLLEGVAGSQKRMVDNFRPVQPLNSRTIYDVDTSNKLFHSAASSIHFGAIFATIASFIITKFL